MSCATKQPTTTAASGLSRSSMSPPSTASRGRSRVVARLWMDRRRLEFPKRQQSLRPAAEAVARTNQGSVMIKSNAARAGRQTWRAFESSCGHVHGNELPGVAATRRQCKLRRPVRGCGDADRNQDVDRDGGQLGCQRNCDQSLRDRDRGEHRRHDPTARKSICSPCTEWQGDRSGSRRARPRIPTAVAPPSSKAHTDKATIDIASTMKNAVHPSCSRRRSRWRITSIIASRRCRTTLPTLA